MGLNPNWGMGWFLKRAVERLENISDKLERIIGMILNKGGGFNLYGSEGPSGPGGDQLREGMRERELQKEPKVSDIEIEIQRANIKDHIRKKARNDEEGCEKGKQQRKRLGRRKG